MNEKNFKYASHNNGSLGQMVTGINKQGQIRIPGEILCNTLFSSFLLLHSIENEVGQSIFKMVS